MTTATSAVDSFIPSRDFVACSIDDNLPKPLLIAVAMRPPVTAAPVTRPVLITFPATSTTLLPSDFATPVKPFEKPSPAFRPIVSPPSSRSIVLRASFMDGITWI